MVSSSNSAGITGETHAQQYNQTHITPLTKINLKRIKDLNIKADNINFLEQNIENKFIDISLGNDFFNMMITANKKLTNKIT